MVVGTVDTDTVVDVFADGIVDDIVDDIVDGIGDVIEGVAVIRGETVPDGGETVAWDGEGTGA